MRKKIICLIEDLASGGAERQLSGLSVLLKNSGYDVEVWTYYPGDFYLSTLQSAGVKYRYIKEAQNPKRRIPVLYKEIKQARPDTVIAYLDTACIIACILKTMGLKFNLIVSERNTTQKLNLRERIKFFMYRFADHVVPNSYSQYDFITSRYPNIKNKTTCITNFVDVHKFTPLDNHFDDNKETTLNILTVARMMPQKNILNYIKAIRLAVDMGANIKVSWFGHDSKDSYSSSCKQLIQKLDLQDVFKFYPAKGSIIEEYQKADVFCLPSSYEGFPNVICEAMCCGLPILCSNVCDNPIIVNDGENGLLFSPNEPKNIADTILRFCGMGIEERRIISSKNRQKALTLFSSKTFIQKYIELL